MPSPIQIAGRSIEAARSVSLYLWPHGGQSTARANAYHAIVDDRLRARQRAEAENAVRRAQYPLRVAR